MAAITRHGRTVARVQLRTRAVFSSLGRQRGTVEGITLPNHKHGRRGVLVLVKRPITWFEVFGCHYFITLYNRGYFYFFHRWRQVSMRNTSGGAGFHRAIFSLS